MRKVVTALVVAFLFSACDAGSTDTAANKNSDPSSATTSAAPTTTSAAPTTTNAAPTTTSAAPTTTSEAIPGFGRGVQIVGTDITPGRYVSPSSSYCYWERLSGFSGDFDDIIANENFSGQGIVDIKPDDVAFDSGCSWVEYMPPLESLESFGEGAYVVGEEIMPGTYRTEAPGFCYWERLSGFSGDFADIIANDNFEGSGIVEIRSSDVGFRSSGDCGTWTPLQ